MTNIQEILDKIGNSNISNQRNVRAIENGYKLRKPVYVFNTEGQITEVFPSLTEARKKYGERVEKRIKKKYFDIDGRLFSFSPVFEYRNKITNGGRGKQQREILAFRNGVLVGEWKHTTEMCRDLDLCRRAVYKLLSGKHNYTHHKGYNFEWKNSLTS